MYLCGESCVLYPTTGNEGHVGKSGTKVVCMLPQQKLEAGLCRDWMCSVCLAEPVWFRHAPFVELALPQ